MGPKTAPGPLTLVKGKAKIADRTTCTFERDRARRYNRGCEIHTDRVLQGRAQAAVNEFERNLILWPVSKVDILLFAGQMQPMLLF